MAASTLASYSLVRGLRTAAVPYWGQSLWSRSSDVSKASISSGKRRVGQSALAAMPQWQAGWATPSLPHHVHQAKAVARLLGRARGCSQPLGTWQHSLRMYYWLGRAVFGPEQSEIPSGSKDGDLRAQQVLRWSQALGAV